MNSQLTLQSLNLNSHLRTQDLRTSRREVAELDGGVAIALLGDDRLLAT